MNAKPQNPLLLSKSKGRKILSLSKGLVLSERSESKGFTLIELLVVIAVLAILATGVLVLIDPIDKISQANDSKVQQDVGAIGRAASSYAVLHNGYFPTTVQGLTELVTSGELKMNPAQPSGYTAYAYTGTPVIPDVCTGTSGATPCTGFYVTGELKAKRYASTPRQLFDGVNNKVCQVAATVTVCP